MENTSQRDPFIHLAGMAVAPEKYITDMEADGQRQLVNSSLLPIDGPWDELAKLGFVPGAEKDDLFREVDLPAGWTRESSDHAMQSYVLDERGVRRVSVFYKAAYYDRKASMHLQNVGGAAATNALYGDKAALPEKWALFNADERADFVSGLDGMDQSIDECPSVYGKYSVRLAAVRKLLAEVSS